jgi:hypothetical protein
LGAATALSTANTPVTAERPSRSLEVIIMTAGVCNMGTKWCREFELLSGLVLRFQSGTCGRYISLDSVDTPSSFCTLKAQCRYVYPLHCVVAAELKLRPAG